MECTSTRLPYHQTGYFTRIVLDYLDQSSPLRDFYEHEVTIKGIEAAIERRKAFPTDRTLLHSELMSQYEILQTSDAVKINIQR